MYSPIIALLIVTSAPNAATVQADVTLPDGRQVKAIVEASAASAQKSAVQVSPQLKDGEFWSFGDAFQRTVFYDCGAGLAPTLTSGPDARLYCTSGSPRLRPDITWPSDASAFPNSNIPPVRPGGRPVTQGLHFLLGWSHICGAAFIFFLALAWFSKYRAARTPHIPAAPVAPP